MIDIYVKELNGTWFGVAYIGERIIATALNAAKEKVVKSILRNIPNDKENRILENGSDFAKRTVLMLKELHAGNEETKSFSLATEHISSPAARVLEIAAAIPIGYVASYGSIAKVAHTGPRVVGRIMARNPLYPIVPCHRVVGGDFSLVGYGGTKKPQALQAKLARLHAECKGFTSRKELSVNGQKLTVYPAEFVIEKARTSRSTSSGQQRFLEQQKT